MLTILVVMMIVQSILDLVLKQIINYITRPKVRGSSCIDWVVTHSEFVHLSWVMTDFISDHCTVYTVYIQKLERGTHM